MRIFSQAYIQAYIQRPNLQTSCDFFYKRAHLCTYLSKEKPSAIRLVINEFFCINYYRFESDSKLIDY